MALTDGFMGVNRKVHEMSHGVESTPGLRSRFLSFT